MNKNPSKEPKSGYHLAIAHCGDVEGILGTKYASLYFHLLNEFYKNTIKDKLEFKAAEGTGNQNFNYWEKIYKGILVEQSINPVPSMIYKYILHKVKDKMLKLKKEAQKSHRTIDQIFSYYIKQCYKVRNKIIEKHKQEGIESDDSTIFHHFEAKNKFVTSMSKKLKFDLNRNINMKRLSFMHLFNINAGANENNGNLLTTHTNLDDSSDQVPENQEAIKNQIEIIKNQIKKGEHKLVKEIKAKKFNHIKSRFLQKETPYISTEPNLPIRPLFTNRTKRQINFSTQTTPHYANTKFNFFLPQKKNISRESSQDQNIIRSSYNKNQKESLSIRKILLTKSINTTKREVNQDEKIKINYDIKKIDKKMLLYQTDLPVLTPKNDPILKNRKIKSNKKSVQFFAKSDFYYN